MYMVDVSVCKPPLHRRKRELIGIAWEDGPGAVVAGAFRGYPATDKLFTGDEILEVGGSPVQV